MIRFSFPKKLKCGTQLSSRVFLPLNVMEGQPKGIKNNINSPQKNIWFTNWEKTVAFRAYIFLNNIYDPFLVSKKIKVRNAIVFSSFSATERNGGTPKRHKNNINSPKKTFRPQTGTRQLRSALIFFGTTDLIRFSSLKKLNCGTQWSSLVFLPLNVMEGHPKGMKTT